MAFTQTQLDALEAALASGALRVSYDGKTVEYRTIDELKAAIAVVSGAIDTAAGTVRRRAIRLYADGKGN